MKWLRIFPFLGLSILFLHPINAGDFFHHLNTGRSIAQTFSLPYTDNLSFTAYGKPWVAYAWGSGLLFYVVVQFFDYWGISVLFALFGSLAGFLIYATLRHLDIKPQLAAVFTLLASSLISMRWPSRPEILGPVFIAGLLFLLTRNKKLSWTLPLFFWAWSIFYGSSAFLGILILGSYILTNRLFSWRALGILCAAILASMLNGYGFSSFFYILQIPHIAPHVGEWLPLSAALNPAVPEVVLFYQYPFLVYGGFFMLSLLVLLIVLIRKWRLLIPTHLFFVLLAFGMTAPFYSNRFINLAPLLVLPSLALATSLLSKKTQNIVLSLVLIITFGAIGVRFINFSTGFGIEKNIFQSKITNYLQEHKINGNIYSIQEIGAWLSWELPHSKVFVDTRDDLYEATHVFDDLSLVDQGKLTLSALLSSYKADIVVGDMGNASTYKPLFYSPAWKLVFLTDGYFILVRNAIAEKYRLRTFDSVDPLQTPPAKSGMLLNAEQEYTDLIKNDPEAIQQYVQLAEIELALNKPQEAKRLVQKVNLAGSFGSRQVMYEISTAELLGKIYTASGDCDMALHYLKTAEKSSYGKLIFFPHTQLPTSVNSLYGDYYANCTNDKEKARTYYYQYLNQTANPIEQRHIEQKLEMLNNK